MSTLTKTGMPSDSQLIELAAVLNAQDDITESIRIITEHAAHLLQAENAFLLLVNPRTQETVRTVNRQSPKSHDALLHEIQIHTSGYIIHSGQNLLCSDLGSDERFSGIKSKTGHYTAALGIPLRNGGVVIGSLVLVNKKDHTRFDDQDLEYLRKLGQIVTPYFNNIQQIQSFFQRALPESVLLEKYNRLGLVGRSDKFIELLRAIDSASRCDVRVMLQGASGTGKELVARAVHKMSDRSGAPFIAIDCGAIPPTLFESELLGHVRGAFTGAHLDRKGLFQEADKGTLFMDEIVNLPLEMQAKLLRVLQEGEIRPIGSNKTHSINVRVIAAASTSLEKRVKEGLFREDLYYRLYVYPIIVPSLEERREDIGLLADHFLKKFAAIQRKKATAFHPHVLQFIKTREWPGNIRELENFIERVLAMLDSQTPIITKTDLPADMQRQLDRTCPNDQDIIEKPSLADQVAAFEANLIRQMLAKHQWRQTPAARELKIPVQTLHNKIKKLKIKR
jgi:transcriptional regulator with GAF, ATPase, and Fis domain